MRARKREGVHVRESVCTRVQERERESACVSACARKYVFVVYVRVCVCKQVRLPSCRYAFTCAWRAARLRVRGHDLLQHGRAHVDVPREIVQRVLVG